MYKNDVFISNSFQQQVYLPFSLSSIDAPDTKQKGDNNENDVQVTLTGKSCISY